MENIEENQDETVKKVNLLAFVRNCQKHGWDKLLEKYGSSAFPKVDASDSLAEIESVVEIFQEELEFVLEEEEFAKFASAIRTPPTDCRASLIISTSNIISSYLGLLDRPGNEVDSDKRSARLYRACKENLMGDFGKAMIGLDEAMANIKEKLSSDRQKIEEMKSRRDPKPSVLKAFAEKKE